MRKTIMMMMIVFMLFARPGPRYCDQHRGPHGDGSYREPHVRPRSVRDYAAQGDGPLCTAHHRHSLHHRDHILLDSPRPRLQVGPGYWLPHWSHSRQRPRGSTRYSLCKQNCFILHPPPNRNIAPQRKS